MRTSSGALAIAKLRSLAVASTLVASTPLASAAQSLCQAGEQDYFSCTTSRQGKQISVCGNIVAGRITDDSWLQYRFGRPGAVELAWPAAKKGSLSVFEGNVFVKYDVVDLRFASGDTLYGVRLAAAHDEDGAPGRARPSGALSIEKAGRKPLALRCDDAKIGRYYAMFEELNVALRQSRGDTDLAYMFHATHQGPAVPQ